MNTSQMPSTDKVSEIWKKNSSIIRKYLQLQPSYQQLASEVAYTLETILNNKGIKYAGVIFRVKKTESFIEKISRKKYGNPLTEVNDIAGVRLVYLYSSDFGDIEKVIYDNFIVVEKVDKLAEQGDQKFGYGAIHYVAKLGSKSSGPRYDDLKGLLCEIQVRTVLQDAWSIINHHLVYKREKDIPTYLKRKINSLSGLFETADDQFDRIKFEREKYIKQIEETLSTKGAQLDNKIDIDNVAAYLEWKFPDLPVAGNEGHGSLVLVDINDKKYKTIADIDSLMTRTEKARQLFNKEDEQHEELSAFGELAVALALDDLPYREDGWNEYQVELFEKYESLVEKI